MKPCLFLLVVIFCSLAYGQESTQDSNFFSSDKPATLSKAESDADVELLTAPIPHPYVSFGPSLMGGGYAPLAYRAETGIDLESSHAMLRALGAYDDGHKTNDEDQPNPSGHDRYLEVAAYFRSSRLWFIGAGFRWNQLATANYTKSASRPEFGGGYDWFLRSCEGCRREFSLRVDADWIMAGNDWQNGSHGPNVALTFPAPSEKRHFFWRQSVGLYRAHETVTEPSNIPLTQLQRSQKYFDSSADFGLIYRF